MKHSLISECSQPLAVTRVMATGMRLADWRARLGQKRNMAAVAALQRTPRCRDQAKPDSAALDEVVVVDVVDDALAIPERTKILAV